MIPGPKDPQAPQAPGRRSTLGIYMAEMRLLKNAWEVSLLENWVKATVALAQTTLFPLKL